MSIFHVIALFGGLALFLYGMRIMGDGLKHGSSGALKKSDGQGDKQSHRRLPAGTLRDGCHPKLHGDDRPDVRTRRCGHHHAAPVHRHHPRRERWHDGHGPDHPFARPERGREFLSECFQALDSGPAHGHPRHIADHGLPLPQL